MPLPSHHPQQLTTGLRSAASICPGTPAKGGWLPSRWTQIVYCLSLSETQGKVLILWLYIKKKSLIPQIHRVDQYCALNENLLLSEMQMRPCCVSQPSAQGSYSLPIHCPCWPSSSGSKQHCVLSMPVSSSGDTCLHSHVVIETTL